MQPHPLSRIIPPPTEEEFLKLVEHIKTHGLIEPIVTYEERILDGNSRERACRRARVEPRYVPFRANGISARAYVVGKNAVRRHLTRSQLATIAFEELLPEERAAAVTRRREAGVRGRATIETTRRTGENVTSATPAPAPAIRRATEAAGARLGVSGADVRQVAAIAHRAPELVSQLRAGTLSIPEAQRTLRQRTVANIDQQITTRRDRTVVANDRFVRMVTESIKELRTELNGVRTIGRGFETMARRTVVAIGEDRFSPEAKQYVLQQLKNLYEEALPSFTTVRQGIEANIRTIREAFRA
jgi:ParB-like chromosome segregation protein Spo0J